jgi:hypothetical protein
MKLCKTRSNLEPDSLKNLFIKNWELGVLKCEGPGLELDQRFCNLFFKILESKTRVLSKKTHLSWNQDQRFS